MVKVDQYWNITFKTGGLKNTKTVNRLASWLLGKV